MSTERELDGLLRPSYELLTIGAVIASTFVLWAYGDLLGLTFFWKVILINARDFLEAIGVSVHPILISNQGAIQCELTAA